MKGTSIGEFEEIVMLATAILGNEAYGYAIKQEILEKSNRTPSLGAVHSSLHRLEQKGFLSSHLAGSTTSRGGKRRRFFVLTAYGMKTLEEQRNIRESMWQSIPGKIAYKNG